MVCGRSYHGGDVQDGCGTTFNWTQAPSYVTTSETLNMKQFEERKPAEVQRTRHWISVNQTPMKCDLCLNDLIGLRLLCIHCPDFNMCLECSIQKGHNANHICKIIRNTETSNNNEVYEEKN